MARSKQEIMNDWPDKYVTQENLEKELVSHLQESKPLVFEPTSSGFYKETEHTTSKDGLDDIVARYARPPKPAYECFWPLIDHIAVKKKATYADQVGQIFGDQAGILDLNTYVVEMSLRQIEAAGRTQRDRMFRSVPRRR